MGGSMRIAKACALLLLATLVSPAIAQAWNGNYIYTPQTGAQTQIDVRHTSTWNIQVTGTQQFSGAKLTMKAGSATTADASFTLYSGSDTSGTVLCKVDLSRLAFTTQFALTTFECPGAPLSLASGAYYATLTSSAPDTQSTAYFIKGYSNTFVAFGPRDPTPGYTVGTSSGLNLLKVAPAASVVSATETYTIYIGNSGPNDFTGGSTITFIDQLPSGMAVSTCVGTGLSNVVCSPYGSQGALLTCSATLDATLSGTGTDPINGPSMDCTVTMPATGGEITNWASIDPAGGTAYPGPVNCTVPGCASAVTTVQASADPLLSVFKSAPRLVTAGEPLNYTVSIGNLGTADLAAGATFTVLDQLWEGATLAGAEPGPGIDSVSCVDDPPTDGLLNCTVKLDSAPLVAGTTAVNGFNFTITVNAPKSQIDGFANYVSVSPDGVSDPPLPDADCVNSGDPNCASVGSRVVYPNVILDKTAPDPVAAGTDFDYTISMGNTGTSGLANGTVVQVAEQLPAGVTLVTQTAGPGVSDVTCNGTTGAITCSVTLDGALPANTTATNGTVFYLTVTAPSEGGTTTNYASVATDGVSTPPTPGPSCVTPNCASVTTTVTAASVVLTKSAPDPVVAGTDFNYTLNLGNTGAGDVADGTVVKVSELLPTGMELVSPVAGAGVSVVSCNGTTGAITCSVTLDGALTGGTAAADGPEFYLTVTAPADTGSTVNYASVAPDGTSTPPTPGPTCTDPGCASAATTVTAPGLVLAKSAPATVTPGTDFDYTLNLGNTGTADVANGTVIQVSELLPTGAELVTPTPGAGVSDVQCTGTSGLIMCSVTLDGALAGGTAAADGPEFTLTVTAPTDPGTSTNYASVASDGISDPPTPGPSCTDPGCASASTLITSPALVLTKTAPDPVVAGEEFVYTVNIGNTGTGDVLDRTVVQIAELLPVGSTLLSAEAGAGVLEGQCDGNSGLVTCSITLDGVLPAGTAPADGPVFYLTVTAPDTAGPTVNYVSVAPDGVSPPPTPGPNCTDPGCASAATTVTAPGLVLSKTAPDPVEAGKDFDYTVSIGNTGAADVLNGTVLQIAELLPVGSTLVGVTPGAGVLEGQCDGETGLVTCSITLDGALPAGTAAADGPVFSLTVTAPSTAGPTVNYVSIAPDGVSPPPAPGPNCTDSGCASAATTVTAPNLVLAKTAPDPVVAGKDFDYTVSIGNTGAADVLNGTVLQIAELLPVGSTLVGVTPGAGVLEGQCDGETGLVTCSITLDGALPAGTAAADGPVFSLTVTAPSTAGPTVNYVAIAPDGVSPPPTPGPNCTDSGCASAATTVTAPNLVLSKTAPDPVVAGEDFDYTVSIGNTGGAAVLDGTVLQIAELLPVGSTLVGVTAGAGVLEGQCDGDSGLVTCSITLDGALPAGTAAADGPVFFLTVTAPSTAGPTVNYVSIAPDGVSPPPAPGPNCTDSGCASAATTVTAPNLVLAKTAPDPVVAGEEFDYTISIGNTGTADVLDGTVLQIAELLPVGTTLVRGRSGPGVLGGDCDGETGLVTCSVTLDGSLPAGTAAADGPVFYLTVISNTAGSSVNYVSIAPDGVSPPPAPGPNCTDSGCASAATTVTAPSLVLSKTAPDPVVAGKDFEYTVNIGNTGGADVLDGTVLQIAELLPAGSTLVGVTPGAGVLEGQCDGDSGLVTCSITLDGTLPAGTAAADGPVFYLTVTAPTATGDATNYVSVAPDGVSPPPTPGPNCTDPGCASAATTVTAPGLVLSKTAPDPVEAGKDFNYTVSIGNTGTADVLDGTVVQIAELLPVGSTLVAATAGAGVLEGQCDGDSGLVECFITLDGALPAGTAAADGPVFYLTVTAPTATGDATNYVSVAPDGVSPPPAPGPNCTDPGCASSTTTVTAPDLVLAKTAPATVSSGTDFDYTVFLGNEGTGAVADGTVVQIAEQLPAGVTLVTASVGAGVSAVDCNGTSGLVTCSVTLDGALATGTVAARGPRFTLTVTAPADGGSIVNYVSVAPDGVSTPPTPGPDCTVPGCASASSTVSAPALVLTKTAPDPVVAGKDFDYTVQIGNTGSGDLASGTVVQVGELLPDGATLTAVTAGVGVSEVECDGTSGLVTCGVTLDGILPGGTPASRGPTFTLTVTAPSTDGDAVNYVSVAPNGVSPPPTPGPNCTEPGCASATTTVTSPGVVIGKTGPGTIEAGKDFDYTIRLGNTGTADLAAGTVVKVGELLPTGAVLVSATGGAGVSRVRCDGTTGLLTCGVTLDQALPAGTGLADGPVVTLTVRAPADAGPVVNYVSVASDGVSDPPTPGPNCTDPGCASAPTVVTAPALVLTKTAPGPVEAGKDFNYTVKVGNTGTADVADGTVIKIAEQLPAGATLVAATGGAGVSGVECDGSTGLFMCSATLDGTLAADTAAADGPEFYLTVTAPATEGETVNYVSVAPDGVSDPPTPGPDCTDPGCASAPTVVTAPALVLVKTGPSQVAAGKDLDYTISLGNTGSGDLASGTVVLVGEQLPAGATLVSANAGDGVSAVECDGKTGAVTCSVTLDGTLASGTPAARGPLFTLTVTAPKTTGAITNYASVAPDGTSTPPTPGPSCTDPGCDSATTTVTAPNLVLNKSAPEEAVAGSDVGYTIELGNLGDADLAATSVIVVADQLPSGSQFVSAKPGSGVAFVQCDAGSGSLVSCKVVLSEPLAAGTSAADGAKFTLTATVPWSSSPITNYASVAADGVSDPPTPGPDCTTPNCDSAKLSVSKPSLLDKKYNLVSRIKAKASEVADKEATVIESFMAKKSDKKSAPMPRKGGMRLL